MNEEKYHNLKLGEYGIMISMTAYLSLSALKLLIAYHTDSSALKADGLNNITDILSSIAVLIGLRLSRKPADHDHPYGHWKAENVASMVASLIMMGVGFQVLYDAILSIVHGKSQSPDMVAAWTGLFCAGVMFGVYLYNSRLSKRINSQAVQASAMDNLSDAWVSVGASIGIIGSQFHLPWLDPAAALIVGVLICKTAWEIFRDTSHLLTDGFDEAELETYKDKVLSIAGVQSVKDIKARHYGNNTVIDLVIAVDPSLDLRHAHDISTKVEDSLIKDCKIYEVIVHVEPSES
ncbi:transporter [Weizmannia acidilactici]|uniref:Transporter n=1 Tax=Weizmannia acidilactici TaxID=2607726 RepID=A0A5J4JAH1_9BACI|nr:cation diffusion facilitator family transporter [Weizmannia acidilactici]GER67498.1 transporter [Weizmannia acidilactici]GER68701.1 transporter [Weizmannia acidilactici]GER74253.1 transporter [Weizmannia acidilactici]